MDTQMIIVYGYQQSEAMDTYLKHLFPDAGQISYGGYRPEDIKGASGVQILYGDDLPKAGLMSLTKTGVPVTIRKFPETVPQDGAAKLMQQELAEADILEDLAALSSANEGQIPMDSFLYLLGQNLKRELKRDDAVALAMSHPGICRFAGGYYGRYEAVQRFLINQLGANPGASFTRKEIREAADAFLAWLGKHPALFHFGHEPGTYAVTYKDGDGYQTKVLEPGDIEDPALTLDILFLLSSLDTHGAIDGIPNLCTRVRDAARDALKKANRAKEKPADLEITWIAGGVLTLKKYPTVMDFLDDPGVPDGRCILDAVFFGNPYNMKKNLRAGELRDHCRNILA